MENSPNQPTGTSNQEVRAKLVAVDMPFGDMILLMVKWALAAIPAILILSILGGMAAVVFGAIAAALRR